MDWTEIFFTDWRSVLPLMKRLGIKGGHDLWAKRTGAEPNLSAASIADDGKILVERGPIIEEWNTDERVGVHLVWDHKINTMEELIEMMSVDAPLFSGLSRGESRDISELWVPGQRRMVSVTCPASGVEGFWSSLFEIWEMSGGACDLHYTSRLVGHEMGAQYGKMFGGIFKSATVALTTEMILTPHGQKCTPEGFWDRRGFEDWIQVVGFDGDQVTMEGPLGSKNRKALSACSAFWASRNWNSTLPTLTEPPKEASWAEQIAAVGAAPELLVTVKPARLALKKRKGASPEPALGDMIACNSCTLFDDCRLARTGAICAIPESDMGELAEFFKTRDSDRIIDGLGHLLGRQADRVEQRIADEESGVVGVSEEVTKMIQGLFDRGVKLAKLVDPALAAGPQVAVNVHQNAVGAISGGSPQQLAAGVVAELEARGVAREAITPEVIEAYLTSEGEEVTVPALNPSLGILPEGR